MKLEHVNTREKLKVRLYDRRGRTIKKNAQRIYRLMRCHQTGRRRVMNWRLIRALYKLSRHYKGKTIRIYSGYRARKVAQLSESYHIKGRAMDIAVRGVNKRALRDYLRRTFKRSGVGYYPNSPFVHFDVRKKRAFWVDISGSGQRSKYVQAFDYLKRERKRRTKKAVVAKRSRPAAKPVVAAAKRAANLVEPPPIKMVTKAVKADTPQTMTKPRVVRGPAPVGPTPPKSDKKPSTPKAPVTPPEDDTSDNTSTSDPERKLSQLPPASKTDPKPEPKPQRAPVSKIRSAP